MWINLAIYNSRTWLDTSKNQCSAPAVTALKNYWRYHVYNLFRLKNSSNVFAFIIIIIGCLKAAAHDSQMLVTATYSQQMTEVISSTSSFGQLNWRRRMLHFTGENRQLKFHNTPYLNYHFKEQKCFVFLS